MAITMIDIILPEHCYKTSNALESGNRINSIKHILNTISVSFLLLEDFASLGRHDSTILRFVILLEVITHLLKSCPFHTLMLIDMIYDSLMHFQRVRAATHVRVDGYGEAEAFFTRILVEVVEMI
jgi:hypothetical protein